MNMLRIATPCSADWSTMTPQDGGRHCAQCDRVVVDLTEVSPLASLEQQRAFAHLFHQGERVCLRTHVGPTGHVRLRPARRRLLTAGLAAMLAMGTVGCTGDDQHLVDRLFPVPEKNDGALDTAAVNAQHNETPTPTLPSIEHLISPQSEDREVLAIETWNDGLCPSSITLGQGHWVSDEPNEIPTPKAPIPLLEPEPPTHNG
jgi:hypothetical protein